VWTGVRNQANLTAGNAKTNQILAENPHPLWRRVGRRQLIGDEHRYPVLSKQFPHGRSWSDPAECLVILLAEHGDSFTASIDSTPVVQEKIERQWLSRL
jgi:hypothetical protein